MITETWLTDLIPDSLLVQGANYCVFRKDRATHGGGVAVFIKNSLKFITVPLPIIATNCEAVCIDVVLIMNQRCRFVCIYNPPSSAIDNQECKILRKLIQEFSSKLHPLFISGDFNFPNIDWLIPATNGNICHDIFLNTCLQQNLSQLVLEPTRLNNILDLVLTNHPSKVLDLHVSAPFASTCDHNTIEFTINVNPCTNKHTISKHNFYKGDYRNIISYLQQFKWHEIFITHFCVKSFWDFFCTHLDYCIDNFIPRTNFKNKPKYPKCIRQLAAKKRRLYRNFKVRPTSNLKAKYMECCNQYSDAVKMYNSNFENYVINCKNPKLFYSYVNNKIKQDRNTAPIIDNDGIVHTDDSKRASIFNNFFGSVFTIDNNNVPDTSTLPTPNCNISSVDFHCDKVLRALKNLPSKCTRSPDGYPAVFLKNIADAICLPLSMLFQKSMSQGVIPNIWKKAIVIPVFKKGNSSKVSNYRPISLTCIICKIMEHIIGEILNSYLLTNNLICSSQFGFLKGRSTCTQLLVTLNDWIGYLNNNMSVDATYIDFAKAFDSVSHPKLFVKLKSFGICNNLLNWLVCFLSNRSQSVCINNSFSKDIPVISGVIQGSNLGPTLFLMYINDITSCLIGSTNVKLFADDCKFYVPRCNSNSNEICLQNTLNKFYSWAKKWQLNVAHDKCFSISIRNHKVSNIVYNFDNLYNLEKVNCVRDIGVTISNDFKFTTHCNIISAKAYSRCYLILKCFCNSNFETLIKAYKVYVRPTLEYCTPVWSPYLQKNVDIIEKIQKYFTRIACIKCNVQYTDYADRLRLAKLDSLKYRRVKFDLIMVYKILNNYVHINKFFISSNTPYNLRRHNKQINSNCKKAQNNIVKYFFSNRIINVWNNLPEFIVNATNLAQFKCRINCFCLGDF
jgi:hypothetical protein